MNKRKCLMFFEVQKDIGTWFSAAVVEQIETDYFILCLLKLCLCEHLGLFFCCRYLVCSRTDAFGL